MPCGTSDGYYEEVRKAAIIPAGGRSESGMLLVVGSGLCQTSENAVKAKFSRAPLCTAQCLKEEGRPVLKGGRREEDRPGRR